MTYLSVNESKFIIWFVRYEQSSFISKLRDLPLQRRMLPVVKVPYEEIRHVLVLAWLPLSTRLTNSFGPSYQDLFPGFSAFQFKPYFTLYPSFHSRLSIDSIVKVLTS